MEWFKKAKEFFRTESNITIRITVMPDAEGYYVSDQNWPIFEIHCDDADQLQQIHNAIYKQLERELPEDFFHVDQLGKFELRFGIFKMFKFFEPWAQEYGRVSKFKIGEGGYSHPTIVMRIKLVSGKAFFTLLDRISDGFDLKI